MATAKVRIFELAKELGLSSKELVTLFNERLGGVFEAKNQLSVVPDQIADLVRSVLLKSSQKPASPAPSAPAAGVAAVPPPAPAPSQPAATVAPPKPAPSAPVEAPVPRLRPVTGPAPRPARPAATQPPAGEPVAAPPAAPEVEAPSVPPIAASTPVEQTAPPRPPSEGQQPPTAPVRRPIKPPAHEPIPQLRPVPAGQQSIVRRQAPPAPTTTASASPGPQTGLPGRPGVAPRPGQTLPTAPPGKPGAFVARPAGQAPATVPGRRHAGNGPFRPLAPAQRPAATPFARPGAAPGATEAPSPLTGGGGGRPGDRVRSHQDKAAAKKDRETELLLEKERQRKKKGDHSAVTSPSRSLEAIEIPDLLTVQELATSMIVPVKDVINELIPRGHDGDDQPKHPERRAITVAKKFGFNASSRKPAKKSKSSKKKTSRK